MAGTKYNMHACMQWVAGSPCMAGIRLLMTNSVTTALFPAPLPLPHRHCHRQLLLFRCFGDATGQRGDDDGDSIRLRRGQRLSPCHTISLKRPAPHFSHCNPSSSSCIPSTHPQEMIRSTLPPTLHKYPPHPCLPPLYHKPPLASPSAVSTNPLPQPLPASPPPHTLRRLRASIRTLYPRWPR